MDESLAALYVASRESRRARLRPSPIGTYIRPVQHTRKFRPILVDELRNRVVAIGRSIVENREIAPGFGGPPDVVRAAIARGDGFMAQPQETTARGSLDRDDVQAIDHLQKVYARLREELGRVIVGQRR